jgi:DNA-binding NtrC family response regulator
MITTETPDAVGCASQRVLFVAPAGADRDLYVTALNEAGFVPVAVPTPAAASALFEAGESFQVVVTELLPDPDVAWSFIERRRAEQPDVPVIIVTSLIRPDRAQQRRSRVVGCAAFVAKPCSLEQMVATVGFVVRGGRRLELLHYVEPGSTHIIE